jgi:hypothetical protein
MDAVRCGAPGKSMRQTGSRRDALSTLLAGLIGILVPGDTVARKGKRKKRKKGKKGRAAANACVPSCAASQPCGPDGCGGSCGSCGAPRTCQGGQCACPEEECGGACVAVCDAGEARNPSNCGCCLVNGQACSLSHDCCSGDCVATPIGARFCDCRTVGARCDNAAQCCSGTCEPNCSGAVCTIDMYCA